MPYNPCCCTPAGCGVCSDGEPSTGTLTVSGLSFTGAGGCPCSSLNGFNGGWALPRTGCGPITNSLWLMNCAAPNGSSGQLLFPVGSNIQYYGAGFSSGFPEYALGTLTCPGPFGAVPYNAYAHAFVGRAAADATKVAVKAFLRIIGPLHDISFCACGISGGGTCAGQAVSLSVVNVWFGFGTSCTPFPTLTWTFT